MDHRDAPLGDSRLSQAYREATHPEPPTTLDDRIMEAARQSVLRPPRPRRSRWFAWALPLSSAAVLVLGITILLEVQRQAPQFMEPPSAAPADAQSATADMAPVPAEPTVSLPYQPPEAWTQQTEAADSVEPVPRTMASAPQRTREVSPAAVAPPSQERPPASPWSASPPGAENQAVPGDAGGDLAPSQVPPQPAAKAETRPGPTAAPAQEAAAGTASRARQDSTSALQSPTTGPAPLQEKAPAFSFSKSSGAQKAVGPLLKSPEQMVETIRRLLRDDRADEARKELAKLRQAYPGFPLPEDLKGLDASPARAPSP